MTIPCTSAERGLPGIARTTFKSRVITITLGLLGASLLIGSASWFWAQEGYYILRDRETKRAWDETVSRWKRHDNAIKKIQRLGGRAGSWEWKFDGFVGIYVDLSEWHGTTADLACLSDLWDTPPDCCYISLKGLDLDDADLVHVKVLQGLQYLDLTDTHVTDTGVAQLQTTIPNVVVIRDSETWQRLLAAPATKYLGTPPQLIDVPVF
jgi:hypothetical protein